MQALHLINVRMLECFYYWKLLEKSTDPALFIAVIWHIDLDNGSVERQRNHSCLLLAISYSPPVHEGAQAISLAFVKEDVFSNIISEFRALFCGSLNLCCFWRSIPKSTTSLLGSSAALGLGKRAVRASTGSKLSSISHLD